MFNKDRAPTNVDGVTARRPARRVTVTLACRHLLLVPLIWWAAGAPPSSAAGGGASPEVIAVAAMAEAFADDPHTGRVFVVTVDPVTRFNVTMVVLDAGSGRVLASVPLGVPDPRGASAGRPRPVGAVCPGCIAVDDRTGRVFVLSPGLPGVPDNPAHPPAYVFMFDATSGRLLTITNLGVQSAAAYFFPAIVVDAGTNHVFSANGGTNRLSMLDATTGRLLRTIVFPNHISPDPSPVAPFGTDSRDGWVLVSAPDGPARVDGGTGRAMGAFHLPDSQALDGGLVDGQRGRAVLAVAGDRAGNVDYAYETIDLATGKLIGPVYGGGTQAAHLLAIDQRSGRVVAENNSPIPPALDVVDDTTGISIGGMDLTGASVTSPVSAIVNPTTGHALVTEALDQIAGPTFLLVEDLRTGKQLGKQPMAGAPNGLGCSIVVDGPTRHVFVANPSLNSVTMLDATKL